MTMLIPYAGYDPEEQPFVWCRDPSSAPRSSRNRRRREARDALEQSKLKWALLPSVLHGVRFRQVVRICCALHGASYDGFFGDSHRSHVVKARRLVSRYLREKGWSLPMIGRAVRRHHTTILQQLRDAKKARQHQARIDSGEAQ